MEYHGGNIVKLKEGGDEDFIILLTKESIEIKDLLKKRDYVIKKINTDEIKHVFEADIYKL